MLEAEQNGKDGFILNKFDLLVTDINELLAEIIQRGALAAPEQIRFPVAENSQRRQMGIRQSNYRN